MWPPRASKDSRFSSNSICWTSKSKYVRGKGLACVCVTPASYRSSLGKKYQTRSSRGFAPDSTLRGLLILRGGHLTLPNTFRLLRCCRFSSFIGRWLFSSGLSRLIRFSGLVDLSDELPDKSLNWGWLIVTGWGPTGRNCYKFSIYTFIDRIEITLPLVESMSMYIC